MMKRYLAFRWSDREQCGIAFAFAGDFDTLAEATASSTRFVCEHLEVLDIQTGEWSEFEWAAGAWLRVRR